MDIFFDKLNNVMIFISIITQIFGVFIYEYIKLLFGIENYNQCIINIIDKLSNINVMFLKIFQWSGIDNKYINEEIFNFIRKLTNNSPWNNSDIDWESLSKTYQLANKLGHKLTIDSFVPINSGSICLVFKGKLDDKSIAIKLLRNGIKKKINDGIIFLENLVMFLEQIPYFKKYHLNKLLKNNKDEIYIQTNFLNEVSNIIKFSETYKRNKQIIIPNVYQQFTDNVSNIIIMDWIDGVNIKNIETSDISNYLKLYAKYMFSSYIIKSVVHSDFHQGNLLFIKKTINDKDLYQIGLLDFGSIIELETDENIFVTEFITNLFDSTLEPLVKYIKDNKPIVFDNYNTESVEQSCEELMNLHVEKKIFYKQDESRKYMAKDIILFLDILQKNQCVIKDRIYKIILSIVPPTYVIHYLEDGTDINVLVKEEMNKIINKFSI